MNQGVRATATTPQAWAHQHGGPTSADDVRGPAGFDPYANHPLDRVEAKRAEPAVTHDAQGRATVKATKRADLPPSAPTTALPPSSPVQPQPARRRSLAFDLEPDPSLPSSGSTTQSNPFPSSSNPFAQPKPQAQPQPQQRPPHQDRTQQLTPSMLNPSDITSWVAQQLGTATPPVAPLATGTIDRVAPTTQNTRAPSSS